MLLSVTHESIYVYFIIPIAHRKAFDYVFASLLYAKLQLPCTCEPVRSRAG